VVPTSAVQRGPAGTFSYVIGDDNIVTAKTGYGDQQNETDAVVASGLSVADRVVTTGFANLSEGAKVIVGKDEQGLTPDLAPRKKRSSRTFRPRMARPRTGRRKRAKPKRARPRMARPRMARPRMASAVARRARAIKKHQPGRQQGANHRPAL